MTVQDFVKEFVAAITVAVQGSPFGCPKEIKFLLNVDGEGNLTEVSGNKIDLTLKLEDRILR